MLTGENFGKRVPAIETARLVRGGFAGLCQDPGRPVETDDGQDSVDGGEVFEDNPCPRRTRLDDGHHRPASRPVTQAEAASVGGLDQARSGAGDGG